jgi:outer membrane protein
MKQLVAALLAMPVLCAVSGVQAQSAGTWQIKAGANTITPKVTSGNLSAPSLPGTTIDVEAASSLIVTASYMYTDNFSVEGFGGLPYKHDIKGAGAIAGAGTLGRVSQVSPTVLGQYRFGTPSSSFRPYMGLGLTYAYFYDDEGSGTLTALTNPGGPPTTTTTDAAFGLSGQIGTTFELSGKWFLDASLIKTYLKTTTNLSTGQSIDVKLDPVSFNFSIGQRF